MDTSKRMLQKKAVGKKILTGQQKRNVKKIYTKNKTRKATYGWSRI